MIFFLLNPSSQHKINAVSRISRFSSQPLLHLRCTQTVFSCHFYVLTISSLSLGFQDSWFFLSLGLDCHRVFFCHAILHVQTFPRFLAFIYARALKALLVYLDFVLVVLAFLSEMNHIIFMEKILGWWWFRVMPT